MVTKKLGDATATFYLSKKGPSGNPMVSVVVQGSTSIDKISSAIIKGVTRDVDIMKKLGLKACLACTSGVDINIRHRFDDIINVKF
jgi:DNA-binding protein YbaB